MTPSTTESTSSITARLRHRLETAQSRARGVPVSMRAAVDRMLERMREALDLPSRTELQELTQRLEELDRKIAALATERVGEMSRVVPALTERAGEPAAETVATAAPAPANVADTDTDIVATPAPAADAAPADTVAAAATADTEASDDEDAEAEAETVTPVEAGTSGEADPAQGRAGKRNKRNGRHRKK